MSKKEKYCVFFGQTKNGITTEIFRVKEGPKPNGNGADIELYHKGKFPLFSKKKVLKGIINMNRMTTTFFRNPNTGELSECYVFAHDIFGNPSNLPSAIFGVNKANEVRIADLFSQKEDLENALLMKSERQDLAGAKDKLTQHTEDELGRLADMRKKLWLPRQEEEK